ncbi:MAG: deoxyribodipyrimidine photo-lyase/cryptochrome family protein [Polyangiaceae bacterium]|nr:deoxyribodipyrimidine photo-lyase/cryptochrome family protein [Polyangiaceae bacterium]
MENDLPPRVVWFKKDLRVVDHEPLYTASRFGTVLCLYIYEPELYREPYFSSSHLQAVHQALTQLKRELQRLGADLLIQIGESVDVLEKLQKTTGFTELLSHQETGTGATYERDLAVGDWCKENGVHWREWRQQGVIRALRQRAGWANQWQEYMSEACLPAPKHLQGYKMKAWGQPKSARSLGLTQPTQSGAALTNESEAHRTLNDFLQVRGEGYQSGLSSPVSAFDSCSRLSHHFTYGTISLRKVFQATKSRQEELRRLKASRPGSNEWLRSISSFSQRLRWHCHFMQKLESEPEIEFQNMARSYDGLREANHDIEKFELWKRGETGYPLIDASMRCLQKTGWINFRMRAMLMSFASYHLWLHWRPTALHLAQEFLDFEPGIHFAQAQMQSGTTGINAIRIYSPSKQVVDHDPSGKFIKAYLPELEALPAAYLAHPQKMPKELQNRLGIRIGKDYPAPVVDETVAMAKARSKFYRVKRSPEAKKEAGEIYQRHGSRRSPHRSKATHP